MDETVEKIFQRWKNTMGHERARLDAKREKAIRSMLTVGYTENDLALAIFGCSVSPFHQGQNERGTKYEDIALICRDAEHVDKFIAIAEKVMAKRGAAKPSDRLLDKPATAMPDNVRALFKKGAA